MILIDVNLLVYAYNKDDPNHRATKEWLEDLFNGAESICFCWENINGFVRVITNKTALSNAYSVAEAFSIVEEWLDLPISVFLEPTIDHFAILKSIALGSNARGPLYSDAILACYAISHNARIASADRDFRLFDGLQLINPLVT